MSRNVIKTLLMLALSAIGGRAGSITYTVDQTVGVGTVTGTITTDGTIGTLFAPIFWHQYRSWCRSENIGADVSECCFLRWSLKRVKGIEPSCHVVQSGVELKLFQLI